MGYPHSSSLEVLIILVVEVVGINPSSYAICALKDMDDVASTLEKDRGIKTCHAPSNDSNRKRFESHL